MFAVYLPIRLLVLESLLTDPFPIHEQLFGDTTDLRIGVTKVNVHLSTRGSMPVKMVSAHTLVGTLALNYSYAQSQ